MNAVRSLARTAVRPRRPIALAVVALLMTSLASGCGGSGAKPGGTAPSNSQGGSENSTGDSGGTSGNGSSEGNGSRSPSAQPSVPGGTAPQQARTSVYFLHGEHVSPAPRTVSGPATAAGAIRALLAGPNSFERQHGRSTAIPNGTTLHSIAVHDHVATVDLSGRYDDGGGSLSMRARLAQVVFTATRFPTIHKVAFELDGKPVAAFGGEGVVLNGPVGRAYFEDLAPAVLVESPLIGDTMHSPVRVWGSANTFEATFRLKIEDSAGRTVANVHVTATSGTGTRGTFDVTIPYRTARAGSGQLIAYYESAEDGRAVTVDTIPLTVGR